MPALAWLLNLHWAATATVTTTVLVTPTVRGVERYRITIVAINDG